MSKGQGNTFYLNAIKDWNKLPMELKTCENSLLKKGLKTPPTEGDREGRYGLLILLSQLTKLEL